ncbi:MAG: immunoglobulin domain-containing protein [bacterium]
MNGSTKMFCATRLIAAGALGLVRGSVERMAFVLALVCALMAPSAARGECPPAWVAGVGTPGTNGDVSATAVLPGGDVLAGGLFTAAGGVPANNIARSFPGAPSPGILWQPVPFVATVSGPAVFTVVPSANIGGVLTYQWYKNGTIISTSTNSTANAPTLYISSVQAGDLGSYSCMVTNTCGSTLSNPAVLSFVRPTCGPSDVAGPGQSAGSDGQLTADDIIVFLNRFFAGC